MYRTKKKADRSKRNVYRGIGSRRRRAKTNPFTRRPESRRRGAGLRGGISRGATGATIGPQEPNPPAVADRRSMREARRKSRSPPRTK